MRAEKRVRVINREGIHARPSGSLVSITEGYESEIRITCRDLEVNGRSILEVITLGASCGSELRLAACGPDAQELVDHLARVISSGFEELD